MSYKQLLYWHEDMSDMCRDGQADKNRQTDRYRQRDRETDRQTPPHTHTHGPRQTDCCPHREQFNKSAGRLDLPWIRGLPPHRKVLLMIPSKWPVFVLVVRVLPLVEMARCCCCCSVQIFLWRCAFNYEAGTTSIFSTNRYTVCSVY